MGAAPLPRPSSRAQERLADAVGRDLVGLRDALRAAVDDAERLAAAGLTTEAVQLLESQRSLLRDVHAVLEERVLGAVVEREAEAVVGAAAAAEDLDAAALEVVDAPVGEVVRVSFAGRFVTSAAAAIVSLAMLLGLQPPRGAVTAAGAGETAAGVRVQTDDVADHAPAPGAAEAGPAAAARLGVAAPLPRRPDSSADRVVIDRSPPDAAQPDGSEGGDTQDGALPEAPLDVAGHGDPIAAIAGDGGSQDTGGVLADGDDESSEDDAEQQAPSDAEDDAEQAPSGSDERDTSGGGAPSADESDGGSSPADGDVGDGTPIPTPAIEEPDSDVQTGGGL